MFQLWKDKNKTILDPELFSKVAKNLAKDISNNRKKNKPSQVRRYFDEIVRLNTLAQENNNDEDSEKVWQNQILPQVHMLISKVAYAQGRQLITESFAKMIEDGIKQIEDKKDLQIFTNFLEAFMGFYKFYRPEER